MQIPGDCEGQGGPLCHEEVDTGWQMNNNE